MRSSRAAPTRRSTRARAAIPMRKEPPMISSRVPAPSTMAQAAPREAPEATPVRSGEASGLRNTVWYTPPASPRAQPASSPMHILGNRSCQNT